MLKTTLKIVLLMATLVGGGVIGLKIFERLREQRAAPVKSESHPPPPVEVSSVSSGELVRRRIINGTLEASAEFVVAPKVSGRVVKLHLDISDPISRGETVAELDDAEYVQGVAQAEADLAVTKAQLNEAAGALEIATRSLQRIEELRKQNMAAETLLDSALTDHVARKAQLEVTQARVRRAEATVASDRIRLGYTRVIADWSDGDDRRVVAERFVDEGETVTANGALFRVVEIDPIIGVVFVAERDYALLRVDQPVVLRTDAYPNREFAGIIARIAPIFRESTRQARVELRVDNPNEELKPGMFIRVWVELARVTDATIVPFSALTERRSSTGLFQVDSSDEEHPRARWRPVEVGIHDGDRVGVTPTDGGDLSGRVVTLGQHLVDDGEEILITERKHAGAATPE